jgi:predicted metalloprotease
MRLDDEQESGNFEVQRGGGGFGGGGLGGGLPMLFGLVGSRFGCGGIVILLIILAVFGMNPLSMLGGGQVSAPTRQGQPDASQLTPVQHLSLKVLGSTERRWTDMFAQAGKTYTPTTLVFYERQGSSGCGAAQAAMGPFYCPTDNRIYLDTSFFDELKTRFGAPGDFAEAYVIAHEVGHHIQTLDGTADKVRAEQQRASEAGANALQVKMELQADCYAGVWAARDQNLLEPGDVESGLRAAQAIGDDTLQKEAQGRVVPESFTHGTSAQRMQWLKRGLDTGDPKQCDTFAA